MQDERIDFDRNPVARELRARVTEGVSDRQVAQAAVRAIDAGIDDPSKIAGAVERDGVLHVAGNTPGYRISVAVDESLADVQRLNQQLAERSQQVASSAVQQDVPALRMT